MYDRCENCNQSFSPEPRFYDGAMYVSYAFSVAIVMIAFIAFNIFYENVPLLPMIFTTIGSALVLSPVSFRLSRSVWIHIFYTFNNPKEYNYITKLNRNVIILADSLCLELMNTQIAIVS